MAVQAPDQVAATGDEAGVQQREMASWAVGNGGGRKQRRLIVDGEQRSSRGS